MSETASFLVIRSWSWGNQIFGVKKIKEILHFVTLFLLPFSTRKQISLTYCQYFKANIYFRKLDVFFLSKTSRLRYNKGWPKMLFSSYLPFLHGGHDFQNTYITFDIFNNSSKMFLLPSSLLINVLKHA